MSFVDDHIRYSDNVYVETTSNGNPIVWRADLGIGYLPSTGFSYSEEYWETYQKYAEGSIGEQLTKFRGEFVSRHLDPSSVCDVGIGNGQFVKHVNAKGFDINPFAKNWLEQNGLFADPYVERFPGLTFWDVLEHFDDPSIILKCTDRVFMSVPIHQDFKSCLESKHLKPNEHIWHFTDAGIKFFMNYHGFECVDQDDGETRAGRESIMTYFFRR